MKGSAVVVADHLAKHIRKQIAGILLLMRHTRFDTHTEGGRSNQKAFDDLATGLNYAIAEFDKAIDEGKS